MPNFNTEQIKFAFYDEDRETDEAPRPAPEDLSAESYSAMEEAVNYAIGRATRRGKHVSVYAAVGPLNYVRAGHRVLQAVHDNKARVITQDDDLYIAEIEGYIVKIRFVGGAPLFRIPAREIIVLDEDNDDDGTNSNSSESAFDPFEGQGMSQTVHNIPRTLRRNRSGAN